MEARPAETFEVHDHLKPKLCDLYENDCIFDKFESCWSHDDRQLLTGSYHNLFRIFERGSARNITLEASRDNITGPTHRLNPVKILRGTPELICPIPSSASWDQTRRDATQRRTNSN